MRLDPEARLESTFGYDVVEQTLMAVHGFVDQKRTRSSVGAPTLTFGSA